MLHRDDARREFLQRAHQKIDAEAGRYQTPLHFMIPFARILLSEIGKHAIQGTGTETKIVPVPPEDLFYSQTLMVDIRKFTTSDEEVLLLLTFIFGAISDYIRNEAPKTLAI